MLITIAAAFLVLMAVLAMFGRFRLRGGPPRVAAARKCPRCGRHRLGRGPCDCGGSPGPA